MISRILVVILLWALTVFANAIEFEEVQTSQREYIIARLHEGYSPAETCVVVSRYFGMDCRVERDMCFLDGQCSNTDRYIVSYGRGLEITYLVTISVTEE